MTSGNAPLACPICGSPVTLRFAQRGRNAGKAFWGCTRFPVCRGALSHDGTAGPPPSPRARTKATSAPQSSSVGGRRTRLERGDLLVSSDNRLGAGKLVARDGDRLVLEYFDRPDQAPDERHRESVSRASLRRLTLNNELRVYWESESGWRSGRVIETSPHGDIYVRGHEWEGHVPQSRLYVRWECELDDPVGFGAAGLLESPLLADMRRPFLQSLLRQRSAAHGMSGALSSSIELHAHQVDTARRILEDPIQRYLLADEVGLGKTIEAGIVIRQLLLDNPQLRVQLVLPPFLVAQWSRELKDKFRVDEFRLAELRFSRDDAPDTWAPADVLVVDEAHNLARLSASADVGLQSRYQRLTEVALASPRLLLLSATPVLHNELVFLAMLKLLDPAVYANTKLEDFRHRVNARSALGKIFLGLRPGLPGVILRGRLNELGELFKGDGDVQDMVSTAIGCLASEDPTGTAENIHGLRIHIAEVYRLHRRMLRTRRTSALEASYHVAGRRPPVVQEITSTALKDIATLLDDWRQEALAACEVGALDIDDAALAFGTACSLSLDVDALAVWAQSRTAATDGERESLKRMTRGLSILSRLDQVTVPLADALSYQIKTLGRMVIFCPSSSMAEELASELQRLVGSSVVATHIATDPPTVSDKAVLNFEGSTPATRILVCDASAEEGRNLQLADALVHVGLPFDVNRLEQRIGRCDRWSPRNKEQTARSMSVGDPANPHSFAQAWFKIVKEGFGVFEQSVASLQHAIDEATRLAWRELLIGGVDAAEPVIASVKSLLAEEIKRVREQDALDSIESASGERSVFARLTSVEQHEAEFADLTDALLADSRTPGNLRFQSSGDPVRSTGSYHVKGRTLHNKPLLPLIPTWRILRDFVPLEGHTGTFVRSVSVAKAGVRLYRYGDQFMDAIADFLWNDDRGRAFGMWRWIPTWDRDERPAFRFDYHVEARPDLAGVDVLRQGGGERSDQRFDVLDFRAVQRRADAAFPPVIVSLWLDERGRPLADRKHLTALAARYRKPNEIGDGMGGDYSLNHKRIARAYELIPKAEWRGRWRDAEAAAEGIVRTHEDVVAGIATGLAHAFQDAHDRLHQLRLRASRAGHEERAALEQEIVVEDRLGEAIRSAIERPNLRLDSTGIVIVSGSQFEGGAE
jgi:ATP-dependent helicase HepA